MTALAAGRRPLGRSTATLTAGEAVAMLPAVDRDNVCEGGSHG